MSLMTLVLILLILSSLAYYLGRKKALAVAEGNIRRLHSLPNYYGYYVALWAGIPALAIFTLWLVLEPQIVQSLLVSSLSNTNKICRPSALVFLSTTSAIWRPETSSAVRWSRPCRRRPTAMFGCATPAGSP